MDRVKGELMSKDAFLNNVPYTKEPYEGILVSADAKNNEYKIGVQISEDQVLKVDQVSDKKVLDSLREWVPRVNEIQIQYRDHNDLEN